MGKFLTGKIFVILSQILKFGRQNFRHDYYLIVQIISGRQ